MEEKFTSHFETLCHEEKSIIVVTKHLQLYWMKKHCGKECAWAISPFFVAATPSAWNAGKMIDWQFGGKAGGGKTAFKAQGRSCIELEEAKKVAPFTPLRNGWENTCMNEAKIGEELCCCKSIHTQCTVLLLICFQLHRFSTITLSEIQIKLIS